MKPIIFFSTLFFLVFLSYGAETLQGSWFSKKDGLTLTFAGEDSLYVTSSIEETMAGMGTFQATDSTINAVIINEDLTIEMSYNYKWENENTIEAQPLFFKINGEDIEVPSGWTKIIRQEQTEEQMKEKTKEQIQEQTEE